MSRIARFRALIDAYGSDPARWPARERAWAAALIDRSAEAGAMRREAAALDALLDRAPRPAAPRLDPAALAASITARPQEPVARWRRIQEMVWLRAVGLAAAAVIGFVVGAAQTSDLPASTASLAPIDVADIGPW